MKKFSDLNIGDCYYIWYNDDKKFYKVTITKSSSCSGCIAYSTYKMNFSDIWDKTFFIKFNTFIYLTSINSEILQELSNTNFDLTNLLNYYYENTN